MMKRYYFALITHCILNILHTDASILGQASRMMNYDRALNERNSIPALTMADQVLSWFRLDDGVMGGQSETTHLFNKGMLEFKGEINTKGGGFCSIRSKIHVCLPASAVAIYLRLKGDGKTYKLTVSDGSKSIVWHADIPTRGDGEEETVMIRFIDLLPQAAGRPRKINPNDVKPLTVTDVKMIGFLLASKLSDGTSNQNYGKGVFPFSLKIRSIELVNSDGNTCK